MVRAAGVVQRGQAVEVECFAVGATQPHASAFVERRRWIVVGRRGVGATAGTHAEVSNAHGFHRTSVLHPVDAPLWSARAVGHEEVEQVFELNLTVAGEVRTCRRVGAVSAVDVRQVVVAGEVCVGAAHELASAVVVGGRRVEVRRVEVGAARHFVCVADAVAVEVRLARIRTHSVHIWEDARAIVRCRVSIVVAGPSDHTS